MKYGAFVRINDVSKAENEFERVAKLGFEACQLVYKPEKYNREAAQIIKNAAAGSGVEISAQFCGFYDTDTVWDIYYGYLTAGLNVEAYRAARVDYIRSAITFASWIGIEDVVIHAGFVPNDPFSKKYALMLTSVKQLAEHCQSMGMNLLLETGGESPIILLRLIEDIGTGNLYINFDPANILMYGYGNPVDALTVFGKYVRNMHGKDGCLPTDTRKIGVETPVGQGMVDFQKIFKILKKLGYDRYVIVEREITGEQQTKDIVAALEYFKGLMG